MNINKIDKLKIGDSRSENVKNTKARMENFVPEINIIQENCYLYSIFKGELKIQSGYVRNPKEIHQTASFQSETKSYLCSNKPGIVYNSVVWLAERDDKLAEKILIEYEEAAIAVLQERIDNHLAKISIIQANMKKLEDNLKGENHHE